jgi:rubrerythrin
MMTTEDAIRTAIDYEVKVRDIYVHAVASVTNPKGKKILEILAQEEQHHVDFLETKLEEWIDTGQISYDRLGTAVPSRRSIQKSVKTLKEEMARKDPAVVNQDDAVKIMERALAAEIETSNFYRRMVDEIEGEARSMFAKFLEIEEGHQAIVQAELDALLGMGFWFDMPEFNLEMLG